MDNTELKIRELREDDDFTTIEHLIRDTYKRLENHDIGAWTEKAAVIKEKYFPKSAANTVITDSVSKGFVGVTNDDKIRVFMGVVLSQSTKNGYTMFGYAEDFGEVVVGLVERCLKVVEEYGGDKFFAFVRTLHGQIRNAHISFWERLGFVSDEYYQTSLALYLSDWEIPLEFDRSGIEAAELDPVEVIRILEEDQEYQQAEEVRDQFAQKSPDHVFISLNDHETNKLVGMAYYKIIGYKGNSKFDAIAFGIHFRPEYYSDRRRLIQAALVSMKQLSLGSVVCRISSKNFATFIALLLEGFSIAPVNILRLVRTVE